MIVCFTVSYTHHHPRKLHKSDLVVGCLDIFLLTTHAVILSVETQLNILLLHHPIVAHLHRSYTIILAVFIFFITISSVFIHHFFHAELQYIRDDGGIFG